VLVYQTAASNQELIPTLQKLPFKFRLYGMGRAGQEGNVTLCAFSETGFVDDLRTAKAVVAGGGFSLMGEAVHLRVPMYSVPLAGQYEQELNARYLEAQGYGVFARTFDVAGLHEFLKNTDTHAHALMRYTPHDNGMLYNLVDELLVDVEKKEPPPMKLNGASMGTYDGPIRASEDEAEVH